MRGMLRRPGSPHRLHDALLRRLAVHPEAGAVTLRGGMSVRHWFGGMGRAARDVDLVCAWPFEEAVVRRTLAEILAQPVDDGVRFAERFRLERVGDARQTALRCVAPGLADGAWGELRVDLAFGVPIWPVPCFEVVDEGGAVLPVCAPQTMVARKLAVCWERGPVAWRPRDLADVWYATAHGGLARTDVAEAIDRTFGWEAWAEGPSRASFWRDPVSVGRWGAFLRRQPSLQVPWDLPRVVDAVRERLA
ncbi:MAG: nucleotidyl transferase AbiEii/AbiGii toxin family protein [Myxococcales bacterium]|nr:nucleotidyl transferase AbiEii/AbiGii toxin family protein [Myxococcales bacterium]